MPADKSKQLFPSGSDDRIPLLIIFANTETTLCKCVEEAFVGAESVQVILDRRRGERRREVSNVGAERRYGERRSRLLIGEQLRSQGWAFVYRLGCDIQAGRPGRCG